MSDKKYPSELKDKFMLRLPDGMREDIKREAEKSGRSMNAEVVYRLEKSLSSPSDGELNFMQSAAFLEAFSDLAIKIKESNPKALERIFGLDQEKEIDKKI